jgi:predicted deacylase
LTADDLEKAPNTPNNSEPFVIGGRRVLPGQKTRVDLETGRLYDRTALSIPVEVVHGLEAGPTIFVCAAIHGDEILGVEIIRRLLVSPALKEIRGTLLAIPVVNVFGFNNRSRYLPDRRDLNRCFPGSPKGSLASQVAHIFVEQIVKRCTSGIDLHSGAQHRVNLPQIRACLANPETAQLAHAFGAAVIINSNVRDGSLRQATLDQGVPILLYEAGEALRYDDSAVRIGLGGILTVMQAIGMLPKAKDLAPPKASHVATATHWLRAPCAGILVGQKRLGASVRKGEILAQVHDISGKEADAIEARVDGIVIGEQVLPLVNRGDAIFHVATFENINSVADRLDDSDGEFDFWEREL